MATTSRTQIDRLEIRERPVRLPLGRQTWGRLLFLHWPMATKAIRPLIPPGLILDTFEDRAWVSVVPFTMRNIRPSFLPALPYLSRAHELNVRTYVHDGRTPGVLFLSLDINHALGVLAGRWGFSLPYYWARISFDRTGDLFSYSARRIHAGAASADFDAQWRIGPVAREPAHSVEGQIQPARPADEKGGGEAGLGTLAFFLLERYCLYSFNGRQLWRGRIWHTPWATEPAALQSLRSTMLRSHGLPNPDEAPLVHYAAEKHVAIYRPERIPPSTFAG